jgi:uncharacterized protein
MKKTHKKDNSKIPYLYLLIAIILISAFLAMIWYGTPDERLLKAVKKCDVNAARNALTKGAHVNLKSPTNDVVNGAPMLFFAAREGCTALVELLLANKADVNANVTGKRHYTGWTALMIAVEKGQTGIVQLLLKRGADVHVTGEDGKTALQIAESGGQIEIVRLLKEAGAK